jgi:hypothetical protein
VQRTWKKLCTDLAEVKNLLLDKASKMEENQMRRAPERRLNWGDTPAREKVQHTVNEASPNTALEANNDDAQIHPAQNTQGTQVQPTTMEIKATDPETSATPPKELPTSEKDFTTIGKKTQDLPTRIPHEAHMRDIHSDIAVVTQTM